MSNSSDLIVYFQEDVVESWEGIGGFEKIQILEKADYQLGAEPETLSDEEILSPEEWEEVEKILTGFFQRLQEGILGEMLAEAKIRGLRGLEQD